MIEYKLPHFLGGVSRQAENQRDMGTLNDSINGYPNISSGLEKRRGMYFHKNITLNNPDDDYLVHWIDTTDDTFVAFISADTTEPIQIFNVTTGAKKTVNYDGTYATEQKAYITSSVVDPVSDIKVLSIFDSSFIVNKKVVCALTGTADGSTTHTMSNGAYGDSQDGTYGLTGTTRVYATYADFPGRYDAGSGNTVNASANHAEYYKALSDSVGNPAGMYLSKATSVVADEELYTIQVTDYDNSLIDYETMPLKLVYNASSDDFDVEYPQWSHRKTGDDLINPGPSFIGRTIDDMVYHKNRLWICSDEFIVSSRTGDFFNFWPNSSLASIRTDPIDETIADEGLNKILYAVPFSEALVLFTEGGRQFEIRSTGPIAPDSISIIPTTSYYTSQSLRPKFLGNNLYFLSDFDNYGQVMEYFYLENASNNVATSVTRHIPDYLPTDFSVSSGDINNGLLLFSNGSDRNVYGYSVQWSGNEKLQNSFYQWTFADNGYNIISHSQINSEFYFVMKNADDDWMITRLDTVNGDLLGNIPYRESLDYVEVLTGGTYDATNNKTPVTFVAKGDFTTDVDAGTVRFLGHSTADWEGFSLEVVDSSFGSGVTTVNILGDWEGESIAVGYKFPFTAELNHMYFKDQNNQTINGTFTMKRFVIVIEDTLQYTVNVDTPGRSEDFNYNYSAIQLDASDILWNEIPLLGTQRTQNIIFGIGNRSRVSITDTSEFPITLVSGEVRGIFNKNLSVR